MKVIVTGSSGQLGQSLQSVADQYPAVSFYFYDSTQLNITDKNAIVSAFSTVQPDYCINTAAYTAVDRAETETQKAYEINATGVDYLAQACRDFNTMLIHISTDFVFDGLNTTPYTEQSHTNPTTVYGKTKLEGEEAIKRVLQNYFIIRTSWVYSQFGHNFLKTMLRLASERDSITVVDDQTGTPTNAIDLAHAILQMVIAYHANPQSVPAGIYNFSNEGQCTWYVFAKKNI